MPRQARLDTPGTFHHIIVRGIEKRQIFDDDKDRKSFVDRMGSLALETETAIYAWALMDNHAHIFLRSGPPGLSKYMRRFLTGQDKEYVLKWFGKRIGDARRTYRKFVENGVEQGHRSDLIGGGLIRSQGGWIAVKDMLRQGVREKSDERILGSGEFVQQLIQQSDIERKRQFSMKENLEQAIWYIKRECKDEGVDIKALRAGSRRRIVSRLRNRLIQNLVEYFGLSLVETGRQMGVSSSAIAKALDRRNIKVN